MIQPEGKTFPRANHARHAQLRLRFETEGLEVDLAASSPGKLTKFSLVVSLQTFLTALTWICPSNGAPLEGHLTVTLRDQSVLCRVEKASRDSSSLRLRPLTNHMPTMLRGVIDAFGHKTGVNGAEAASRPRHGNYFARRPGRLQAERLRSSDRTWTRKLGTIKNESILT